jgi:hypothetical protein
MGIYLLYNNFNDANLRVVSSVISIINIEIKNALSIKNTFLVCLWKNNIAKP